MGQQIIAKSYIEDIKPYVPGLSKTNNDKKIIKLSSNENALGSSPKAIKAYKDHAYQISRYPDGDSYKLRHAIAKKYNIDDKKIVCAAGSDETISLLIQAFIDAGEEVLYSEHGFLMYPISTKKVGGIPITAKEIDLTANIENIISKISPKTKMIFIANPNNPTGSYINHQKLEKLINLTPKHIIIVLDLAYAEFVDLADYPNGIDLVNKNDNVVMTRTFSKIHGLASLRLGWSYSSGYIANILNRVRGPFNVSGAAQEAGIAAINDQEFVKKSKQHNNKWLKIISESLNRLGIRHYPSVANFILIDFLNEEKCRQINQYLLDNGIILRAMDAYKLPTCLRMTIGIEDENQKVLSLLEQCTL